MKYIHIPLRLLSFLTILFSVSSIAQSIPIELIKDYMVTQGMSENDVIGLKIQRTSFSKSLNATNVYVIQEYKGIPIYNAIGSYVIRGGEVLSYQGQFYNELSQKIKTTVPKMTPANAVLRVVSDMGLHTKVDLKVIRKSGDTKVVFIDKDISEEEIPVELVYAFKNNQLILCWDLSLYTKDGKNWHSIRVDATSGEMMDKTNWMTECTFDNLEYPNTNHQPQSQHSFGLKNESTLLMEGTYTVYPIPSIESPNHGDRVIVTNPADPVASPFGWHDTNGVAGADFTTTTGNNVIAAEDVEGNNGTGRQVDGGAGLVFDFPFDRDASVEDFEEASITNLFYTNNVAHDVWYHYGFDEASGNFQSNNYNRGGLAGDEVFADAQDGSGFNNANFGSPPDGTNPRMQMFLWNPTPDPSVSTFVVNNGNLVGSYTTVDNSFNPGHVDAPEFPDGSTGTLVLAVDDDGTEDFNDACSDITNTAALNGRIAVVRRGTCNFDDKIVRCQTAGAIAVLVVNNVTGAPIPMGGGDSAITIPAIMIGMDDGETLIAEMLLNTVNATVSDAGRSFFAEDSSFDNGIVVHEYGHGISTRLTGGANNSGCLRACADFDADGNCIQSTEQMGEGWSDWFALMMTIEPGDTAVDTRGIGTYTINQPTTGRGIRPFPYSTDMGINPVTFDDTNNANGFPAPHGVGSVWASMLWDLTWALIERDGFDSDIYNGTGGNNLAMQLVIDGLKLQTCNPGFVDARNAILMADEIANAGSNACVIWEVFAKRGLGWSASQGDSQSRTDQQESFDLPPASELSCLLNVDEFDENNFRITPNPSRGSFIINLSKDIGESNLRIHDINGRIVYDKNIVLIDSYTVNTSGLRTGIYVLYITAKDGNSITKKIAIQ